MSNKILWQKLGFNILISTILFGIFFGILFLLEYYIPELHNKLLNFDDIAFNIGIVASFAGVGYTLTIRNPENFIGFYLGIVMSLLLGIQFFLKNFYDLTFLYIVVFIPFQITSIITWKKVNNVKSEPTFLPPDKKFLTIFLFLILIICDYFFATYIINKDSFWQNSFDKIINGIVIASSILANFWLIFKKIDAWIYWIIYSVASVIQGIFVINNPFNTILSLFFIIINSLATYSWIKNYKMPQNKKQVILSKISRKVKKAIYDFGLINDGDKILIGLSGGKDSLALTELLAKQQKIAVPNFTIIAAHVSLDNIPYQSDIEFLSNFCNKRNIEFKHIKTHFEPANDKKKDEKTPCFFCSWSRRKALFDIAKKLGCNKIALGHHQNDIIETLLLNMIFQSSISTMPPMLKMTKFDITIIRPLCLLSEQDLLTMQELENYPKQTKTCPFEKTSKRSEIKNILKIFEQLNPNVRQTIWGAMQNIQQEYLPKKINL